MTAVTLRYDVAATAQSQGSSRPFTLPEGATYDVGIVNGVGVIELAPLLDVIVDLRQLADATGESFVVECGTCGGRGTTGQPRNSNVRPCRACRGVGSRTVSPTAGVEL